MSEMLIELLVLVGLGCLVLGFIIGHKLSNVKYWEATADEYLRRLAYLKFLLEMRSGATKEEILQQYKEFTF